MFIDKINIVKYLRISKCETNIYFFFSVLITLTYYFFSADINQPVLLTVLAIFVIVFGLPHGALDTILAKQYNIYSNLLGFVFFNFVYLGLALFMFVFWYFYPIVALSIFLLISLWHFSEDWQNILKYWERIFIGIYVLSLPVVFHKPLINEIYFYLTGSSLNYIITDIQFTLGLATLPFITFIVLKRIKARKFFLQVVTLFLTAILLNPILYFLSYFCFFHSIKNYKESLILLKDQNMKIVYRIVLINTLLSVVLGILMYFYYFDENLEVKISKVIFIGLACLTVPHMILKVFIHKNIRF